MKFSKVLTVFAAATMIAAGVGEGQVVSADDVSDARAAVSANQSEGAQLLAKIQVATGKVDKLNNDVSDKIVAIASTRTQITATSKTIKAYDGKIAQASSELTSRKKVLKKQLISLQKKAGDSVTGNVYFDFLLNSTNLSDLVDRTLTVNKLDQANKDAMNSVEAAKTKLSDIRKDQQTKKTQLVAKQDKLVQDQKQLVTLKKAAVNSQAALTKEYNAHKTELVALQNKLNSATAAAATLKAAKETEAAKAKMVQTATNTPVKAATQTVTVSKKSTATTTTPKASGNATGIVGIAENYLGVPYVYGGSTPKGFDCSGFVQYVERAAGVSLPRTSMAQSTVGSYVSLSNLQVGDLVFWGGVGSAYHVGIYIGGGRYIHAPAPGQSVSIQSISYFSPSFGRRL
ncbi:C40 family peptidase [Lacticaseibacillus mingshuiensis]|uniref:NlpC/P60 family protein n=1 Tax=Lacticaseibacillus mingshuiensis TaxID=2799574 RepID=A0ABW4CKA7_9LACO|nr:C40 family peptidase [Lacticaseibacillus mingshuiensis]